MHRPQDIEKVLRKFPIEDVWGIGRKTARKLHDRNISTAWEFTQMDEGLVRSLFGIVGLRTWQELRGIPAIEFEDTIEAKQSICVSRSFAKEITEVGELAEQVANFAASAAEKLRAQHSACVEMMVFAYTNRFKENEPQTYGSVLVSYPEATNDHRAIVAAAVNATREVYKRGYGYKKAGVVISKLIPESGVVRSLFADNAAIERENRLSSAMDAINHTFGRGAVKMGIQGSGRIKSSSESQSPHYTTLWSDIPKVTVK
jgi:DNA polymerase V